MQRPINLLGDAADLLAEASRPLEPLPEPDPADRISLHEFLEDIWWIVEPETPFTDGWHLRALCDHIEALFCGYTDPETRGHRDDLRRLIINIPPGLTKSLCCSIATPCWLWTFRPSFRWLIFTYHEDLSNDLAQKRRSVLMSDYYRNRWPVAATLRPYSELSARVRRAQPRKTRDTIRLIQNMAGGRMQTTTTGGAVTGQHPQGIIGDDPVPPPDGAELLRADPLDLRRFAEWWRSKVSTRGYADDVAARTMLVMQRVALGDPSDILLAEGDCDHLMLPMRYDPGHPVRDPRQPTRLGFVDPRTQPGELICPARVSEATVATLMQRLSLHNALAQLQQNPQQPEGQMFSLTDFDLIDALPLDDPVVCSVRHWDLAATEQGGDYTAGCQILRLKSGRFVIAHVERGQWSCGRRDEIIRAMARKDGVTTRVGLEREGGSGGTAQVETLTRLLAGFHVHEVRPDRKKDLRAEPLASAMQVGNVWILRGDWTEAFLDELQRFPGGRHDDQVDAASGAFYLAAVKLQSKTWAGPLLALSDEEYAAADERLVDVADVQHIIDSWGFTV